MAVFPGIAGFAILPTAFLNLACTWATRGLIPSRFKPAHTDSCQVYLGLSTGAVPSTTDSVQTFTQSASYFQSTETLSDLLQWYWYGTQVNKYPGSSATNITYAYCHHVALEALDSKRQVPEWHCHRYCQQLLMAEVAICYPSMYKCM